MSDDVITGVGALIVIGSALCPFFPQACPAVAGLRAIKTYLEKRKAEEDGRPKPNVPQDVSVHVNAEDESQESQGQESNRIRV